MKKILFVAFFALVTLSNVFAGTPPVSEEKIAMKNIAQVLVQASLSAAGEQNTDVALGFAVAAGDVAREAGFTDLEQEVNGLMGAYRIVGLLNTAATVGQQFPLAAGKLSTIACEVATGVMEGHLRKMIAEALSFCKGREVVVYESSDETRLETMNIAKMLIGDALNFAQAGATYEAVGYALAASDIARHYRETALLKKIDDAIFAYRVVILDGVAELFAKEGGKLGVKGLTALTCKMVTNVTKEHRPLVEKARACGVSI